MAPDIKLLNAELPTLLRLRVSAFFNAGNGIVISITDIYKNCRLAHITFSPANSSS